MIIEPIESSFNRVESLIQDAIFKLEVDNSSPDYLKKLKIFEARYSNPDFELELAEFICGDNNSFPYRSSFYLTEFFKNLGFPFKHDGRTRRFWVRDILLELTTKDISLIIEKGLFKKRDFKKHAQEKNTNLDENFKSAQLEFKTFFEESLCIDEGIDLANLIGLNINIKLLFDKEPISSDQELNSLIKEAKDRFCNPKDKQIAVEKLWDAYERLKTYYGENKKKSADKLLKTVSEDLDSEIFKSEFTALTKIGNDFRIRHHETGKKEIKKTKHLNYLFFRMLSLLDLCLSSIGQNGKIP